VFFSLGSLMGWTLRPVLRQQPSTTTASSCTVTAAAAAAAAAAGVLQLYNRMTGFAADMVSGGDVILVDVGQGPQLLLSAAAFRHNPAYRMAKQAHYQVHGQGVAATRDIAKDKGWVGGGGGKRA
jgi:hypothetical protein